jgi:hypothetical protein
MWLGHTFGPASLPGIHQPHPSVRPRARRRSRVTNQQITYIVGAGCGLIALIAFGTLVLVPALTAYRRPMARVGAALLSLYILAAFVGVGIVLGALIILEGPKWF